MTEFLVVKGINKFFNLSSKIFFSGLKKFELCFKEIGFGVFNYHDQVIHPPGSLKTKAGGNFSVYSPFKRKWFEELTEEQLTLFDIPSPKNKVNIESSDVENISKKFATRVNV